MGGLQIPTAIQSTMPSSKIVVVSAAVFGTSYSSALFVPAPVFQHLEGACRTAELNTGTFHTLQGISRSDCEFECIRDPNCVAYEHNSRGQCEIHSEAITQTARSFGTACYIKSQFEPEPEIVFCAGDVFECPGVSGFFVSRDPGNNCEFKVEECPQVEPKPEPEIVLRRRRFRMPGRKRVLCLARSEQQLRVQGGGMPTSATKTGVRSVHALFSSGDLCRRQAVRYKLWA